MSGDANNETPEDATPVAFTRPADQLAHGRDDSETALQSFVQRRIQESYRPKKEDD